MTTTEAVASSDKPRTEQSAVSPAERRRERGKKFLERYDGIVVDIPLNLGSRDMRAAFDRTFDYAMMCVHDVMELGSRALDEDTALVIQQEARNMLKNSITALEKQSKKLAAAIGNSSLAKPASFSVSKDITATVTHPMGRDLLDLLAQTDRNLQQLGHLWFDKTLDDKDYREEVGTLRRGFYTTVLALSNLRRRMFNVIEAKRKSDRGADKAGAVEEQHPEVVAESAQIEQEAQEALAQELGAGAGQEAPVSGEEVTPATTPAKRGKKAAAATA